MILTDFPTAGVSGLHPLPRPGYIGESGRCAMFACEVSPEQLADFWCGPVTDKCPYGEYADRFAREMRAMLNATGQAWGGLGGHWGNYPVAWESVPGAPSLHWDQTYLAMQRYKAALDLYGVTHPNFIIDDEHETGIDPRTLVVENAAYIADMLYSYEMDEEPIFDASRTRAVCWAIYDGIGEQRNEWGRITKVRGVCDTRTACVHGYLNGSVGVSWSEQVDNIVRQAAAAKCAGYDIVPIVTGALADQVGTPYTDDLQYWWREMVAGLREYDPIAWWIFNAHGQGTYPLADPTVDYSARPYPPRQSNWPLIVAESIATVEAIGG